MSGKVFIFDILLVLLINELLPIYHAVPRIKAFLEVAKALVCYSIYLTAIVLE
jgi:hypothetical protein